MEPSPAIHHLLTGYLEDTLTAEQEQELFALLQKYPQDDFWAPYLQKIGLEQAEDGTYDKGRWQSMAEGILRHAGATGLAPATIPVPPRPGRTIPRYGLAAAAAVLLLAGPAIYISRFVHPHVAPKASFVSKAVLDDAPPGGSRATLTLAGGQQIVLDSSRNGELATQGNSRIRKLREGELTYTAETGNTTDPGGLNTLSTPRGGQYALTLSDGTKVWLNAASSITFPASFRGKQRTVSVTGEVYLEVAKSRDRPFEVSLPGGQLVQVLGTAFDINAYADEPVVNTTLVEGSVRVVRSPSATGGVILRPGQQAVLPQTGPDSDMHVREAHSIEQTLAWKNGYFAFDNTSVEDILRQVSRWYDLDVVYLGEKPDKHYKGKIPLDLNASTILRIIGASGVHFTIKGKKIEVN